MVFGRSLYNNMLVLVEVDILGLLIQPHNRLNSLSLLGAFLARTLASGKRCSRRAYHCYFWPGFLTVSSFLYRGSSSWLLKLLLPSLSPAWFTPGLVLLSPKFKLSTQLFTGPGYPVPCFNLFLILAHPLVWYYVELTRTIFDTFQQ